MPQIKADKITLVSVLELKPNPGNRNKHSPEQIDRLCKLIKTHGFRQPILVSAQTGFVVAGHGRLEAAKKLNLERVPVMVQEFATPEEEYAVGVSDNAIASWAELDLSGINMDLAGLDPSFDLELLGIASFALEKSFEPGTLEEQGKLDEKKPLVTQCPNCGECFDANENKPTN